MFLKSEDPQTRFIPFGSPLEPTAVWRPQSDTSAEEKLSFDEARKAVLAKCSREDRDKREKEGQLC